MFKRSNGQLHELLTGRELVVSKLITPENKIESWVGRETFRLSLHSCCNHKKHSSAISGANEVNEAEKIDKIKNREKIEESDMNQTSNAKSNKTRNCEGDQENVSLAISSNDSQSGIRTAFRGFQNDGTIQFDEGAPAVQTSYAVFAVVFRCAAQNLTDAKGRSYSVFLLTDLRGSFARLLSFNNSVEVMKRLKMGTLIGLMKPSLLPVQDTDAKNSRTFVIDNQLQLVRVALVKGFSLCPFPLRSDHPCGQPLDSLYLEGKLCPLHLLRLQEQRMLDAATRRNLECDGVFVGTEEDGSQRVSRACGALIETRVGAQGAEVRVTKRTVSTSSTSGESVPVLSEGLREVAKKRATSYIATQLANRTEELEMETTLIQTLQHLLTLCMNVINGAQTYRQALNLSLRDLNVPKCLAPAPDETQKQVLHNQIKQLKKELLAALQRIPQPEDLSTAIFLAKRKLSQAGQFKALAIVKPTA